MPRLWPEQDRFGPAASFLKAFLSLDVCASSLVCPLSSPSATLPRHLHFPDERLVGLRPQQSAFLKRLTLARPTFAHLLYCDKDPTCLPLGVFVRRSFTLTIRSLPISFFG